MAITKKDLVKELERLECGDVPVYFQEEYKDEVREVGIFFIDYEDGKVILTSKPY